MTTNATEHMSPSPSSGGVSPAPVAFERPGFLPESNSAPIPLDPETGEPEDSLRVDEADDEQTIASPLDQALKNRLEGIASAIAALRTYGGAPKRAAKDLWPLAAGALIDAPPHQVVEACDLLHVDVGRLLLDFLERLGPFVADRRDLSTLFEQLCDVPKELLSLDLIACAVSRGAKSPAGRMSCIRRRLGLGHPPQPGEWSAAKDLDPPAVGPLVTDVGDERTFFLKTCRETVLMLAAAAEQEALSEYTEHDLLACRDALRLLYGSFRSGLHVDTPFLSAKLDKQIVSRLVADWQTYGRPLWQALDREWRRREGDEAAVGALRRAAELQRIEAVVGTKPDGRPVVAVGAIDGPSLVVCEHPFAPPSGGSRDEESELQTMAPLLGPLPLAAMPAPSELRCRHQALLDEFPWAESVLATIFDELVVRARLGCAVVSMKPTLLVGAPGAGKSRLARRIADVMGLERIDIALGGNSDPKALSGTTRGWFSARPGDVPHTMALRRTASLVVLLDEIDKAGDGRHDSGGINAYLLALLEPETARRHRDVFLKTECDLSQVLWLATANQISPLSAPLQSRFRILHLEQPRREHFPVIAECTIAELAQEWGVDRRMLPSVHELDLPLARLSSAREVGHAVTAGITRWGLREQAPQG